MMAIHGREKTKTFSFFGSIVREAKTTVTVKKPIGMDKIVRQIVPGVRILVAATKNRRGRPSDSRYKEALRINTSWQLYNPEVSTRAIQNAVNAEELFCLILETNDPAYDFFVTCEGHMKHKGIAEQIGRMMHEGMITDEQAMDITHECIEKYENGRDSKDIEKRLRKCRMEWKSALRGEE